MKKKLFPILLILFITVFFNTYASSGISKIAANFELPSFSDNNNYQLKQFKGNPVILNFWASWCAPCKQEMPFLETVWEKNKDKGLVLVGINIMDDKEEAENILKKFEISYLNLYGADSDVREKYNLFALPVTYFIDRDGIIAKINYGPFLGKEGEELFNNLLNEIMK